MVVDCIDTYLPREGPETSVFTNDAESVLNSVDTDLPREGSETLIHQIQSFP